MYVDLWPLRLILCVIEFFYQADPSGPEFSSKFHSIEQSMVVRFSSLKLTAKQEAIASFELFVLSLFQR